eukprot:5888384-Pleurochrysis_carterae.AAC.2
MGHQQAFTAMYMLMEGFLGCPTQPNQMRLIGSYVLRGAGCHETPYGSGVLQVVVFATPYNTRPHMGKL